MFYFFVGCIADGNGYLFHSVEFISALGTGKEKDSALSFHCLYGACRQQNLEWILIIFYRTAGSIDILDLGLIFWLIPTAKMSVAESYWWRVGVMRHGDGERLHHRAKTTHNKDQKCGWQHGVLLLVQKFFLVLTWGQAFSRLVRVGV